MMVNILKMPSWMLIALMLLGSSCVSDPWPEPDSMEQGDDGSADPAAGTDADSDGDWDYNSDTEGERPDDEGTDGGDIASDADTDADVDTDADADGDMDVDSDTDGDTDSDTETDMEAIQLDRIFVSTPDANGEAVVVGLSGAVVGTGQVFIMNANNTRYDVLVGPEGGFATRIQAAPGDEISIWYSHTEGFAQYWPLVVGDLNEQFTDGVIGTDGTLRRLNDTLVNINGQGDHLSGGYFVVAGNVTTGAGGMTEVICIADTCEFSLIMTAIPEDELDLFLVRNAEDIALAARRVGTVSQTLVAP